MTTANVIHSPAASGLTASQNEAYQIVVRREKSGLTITSGDVARDWGDKHRSHVYRVLKSLEDKKLIERYGQRYYQLKKGRKSWGNQA